MDNTYNKITYSDNLYREYIEDCCFQKSYITNSIRSIVSKCKVYSFHALDRKILILDEYDNVVISISLIDGKKIKFSALQSLYVQSDVSYLILFEYVSESLSETDRDLLSSIKKNLLTFSQEQISAIIATLPLLKNQSLKDNSFDSVCLIWRDHFLEENVALLEALMYSGLKPENIIALSKGDKTKNVNRIFHYLESQGITVGLLDNGVFDSEIDQSINRSKKWLIEYFRNAKKNNLTTLVIDDGAMIWKVFDNHQELVDCAIELTLPGVRRIENLSCVEIPIFNLGQSDLKKVIGYPEISRSCFLRLHELLSYEKFYGRGVVILGYGTAGRIIASLFRDSGSRVSVVDTDILKLIEAANHGYSTYRNLSDCLKHSKYFLLIGCSGDLSIDQKSIGYINNGTYVTGIATRDLYNISMIDSSRVCEIPGFGRKIYIDQTRFIYQIGDGRSINLFESEAIPNKGYDIFKTAIYMCAKELCRHHTSFRAGLLVDEVNDLIRDSGILEDYYNLYLNVD